MYVQMVFALKNRETVLHKSICGWVLSTYVAFLLI